MNQMNEMNNEEPDIDIQTAFIGTMGDIISKLSSGSITDTKNVMLYFEGVEGVKYSFKVSVKSFIDREKTVLHERMSFVDIFKAFKDKLAAISLMNTKKSTKVLFEELVIQKLSEGNEYKFVDTNKFHLVEDSFIDWVTESFPELLQYTNPAEGNDYLRFEYEREYYSWRVYANKDFTVGDNTITKNTKGGLVDNPSAILGKTWIENGCSLSDNCLVKNSIVSAGSKVKRSVLLSSKVAHGSEVFKSTLVNSKLFASDVFESNFWEVDTRQSRYSLIHALNISDAFELLCGSEKRGRLLSVYAGGVSFRPFSTRRVGSEDGLITVGTTVDGKVTIVRGCFEGSLEEFKARLDKDLERNRLETEPYYHFVKYLHDKVAAKRYEALTPLVEKSQALFKPFEKISLLKKENIKSLYYVLCTGSEEVVKLLSEAEEASRQLIEYYEENFDD